MSDWLLQRRVRSAERRYLAAYRASLRSAKPTRQADAKTLSRCHTAASDAALRTLRPDEAAIFRDTLDRSGLALLTETVSRPFGDVAMDTLCTAWVGKFEEAFLFARMQLAPHGFELGLRSPEVQLWAASYAIASANGGVSLLLRD
ncbi:hypothetical protein [Cellulomonas sp. KRMCY2]|uniref:hypothetical protein n=1 Tax=Cellulomonas sp. KRMCY2 TaxID=1304865 RepID=UPI00045EBBCB|nr:hypothetical protein [Cellulomonas sp. KRMCY2]